MNPVYLLSIVMAIALSINVVSDSIHFKVLNDNRNKMSIDYAVNSASDASIQQMLETSQKTPTGNIVVSPDYLWKIYKYTFLKSINNWSVAEMDNIESSFPVSIIAVNDGYYIRLLVDEGTSKTEKNYRFTQKIPFARTTLVSTPLVNTSNSSGQTGSLSIPSGTIVSDTMNGTNIVSYLEGDTNGTNNIAYKTYGLDGHPIPNIKGGAHDLIDINLMLLQAIDYSMFYNTSNIGSNNTSTLVVPNEIADNLLSPSVSFVGPSIFVMSDNITIGANSYKGYSSVGGSQLVESSKFYGYTRDGVKYYSRLNPEVSMASLGIVTENIYSLSTQAAIDGYKPDPLFY